MQKWGRDCQWCLCMALAATATISASSQLTFQTGTEVRL